jgi:hypothetical protein
VDGARNDDAPVATIESYLSYLSDIERSPNTVKAYAHDLKDYFVFLAHHGVDWREVRLEDIGEFVGWLRLPPAGRWGQVAVLPSLEPRSSWCGHDQREAVGGRLLLCHQARHGVDLGELLVTWLAPGRSAWKPFLHHISKSGARKQRTLTTISLKTPHRLPRAPAPRHKLPRPDTPGLEKVGAEAASQHEEHHTETASLPPSISAPAWQSAPGWAAHSSSRVQRTGLPVPPAAQTPGPGPPDQGADRR